jgi:hypothetical protein
MMKNLPNLYKRSAGELYFFGWMIAFRKCLPSVSIKDSVIKFISEHDVVEGVDTEVKTMMSTFIRMQKEYFESNKTVNHG